MMSGKVFYRVEIKVKGPFDDSYIKEHQDGDDFVIEKVVTRTSSLSKVPKILSDSVNQILGMLMREKR